MSTPWFTEELDTVALDDKRLNGRYGEILEAFGKPLSSKPPPLKEMVRLIARLGGYVDRPNRGDPPGVETMWKGMQRMQDLAWGWQTFGPGADSLQHLWGTTRGNALG